MPSVSSMHSAVVLVVQALFLLSQRPTLSTVTAQRIFTFCASPMCSSALACRCGAESAGFFALCMLMGRWCGTVDAAPLQCRVPCHVCLIATSSYKKRHTCVHMCRQKECQLTPTTRLCGMSPMCSKPAPGAGKTVAPTKRRRGGDDSDEEEEVCGPCTLHLSSKFHVRLYARICLRACSRVHHTRVQPGLCFGARKEDQHITQQTRSFVRPTPQRDAMHTCS